VKLLAADLVDPDFKDEKCRTPLSLSVEIGHEAMVRLLLATDGVDPDSKDKNGHAAVASGQERARGDGEAAAGN